MVSMTATIDGAASAAIERAIKAYGEAMGDAVVNAPRIAALAVCDSLRKRTKQAKKYPKSSEYSIEPSPVPPRYITYSRGQRLPIALHRWRLTRHLGTEDQKTGDYFTYAHIKHSKRGKIVKDVAAEKEELKRYRLENLHRGLAKRSWNWVKAEIYKGAKDAVWTRRKYDKRNPTEAVEGNYTKRKSMTIASAEAKIKNRLDYIEAALQPMALDEAMRAAAKKLAFKTATAQGMTPEQAAQYARDLARDFERVA